MKQSDITPPQPQRRPQNHPQPRRRQPNEFRETLAAPMPMARVAADETDATLTTPTGETPARTDWLRYGLYLVWALAAVAAGTAVGLMLNASRFTVAEEAPVPVATATVVVTAASHTNSQTIAAAINPAQPTLRVAAGSAVTQAQAGNPFAVMASATLQPASTAQLQPGFRPAGMPQGNLGTAAVR